jgi:hypothetical protein
LSEVAEDLRDLEARAPTPRPVVGTFNDLLSTVKERLPEDPVLRKIASVKTERAVAAGTIVALIGQLNAALAQDR